MSLETGSHISDLVVTNPTHADSLSQTDSHIRLIKSALKTDFPNINAPVTITPAQLSSRAYTYSASNVISWPVSVCLSGIGAASFFASSKMRLNSSRTGMARLFASAALFVPRGFLQIRLAFPAGARTCATASCSCSGTFF
jgi:hypothetical protein